MIVITDYITAKDCADRHQDNQTYNLSISAKSNFWSCQLPAMTTKQQLYLLSSYWTKHLYICKAFLVHACNKNIIGVTMNPTISFEE